MNSWSKTFVFLVIGVCLSVAAYGTHLLTQPQPSVANDLAGNPMFEPFEPSDVKSLEVVARDPITKEIRRFKVEQRDGVWRIPSHHNYPAEAAKRLANTAVSLFGLERIALAGQRSDHQKRLGVVAPDDDEAAGDDPDEIGKRVILRDASDNVLADLIVGKAAEQSKPTNQRVFEEQQRNQNLRYVRRGDETATYVCDLNVDLSTRFSDWIEPDLLQLDPPQIKQIVIDNYELDVRDELTSRGIVRSIAKKEKGTLVLDRDQPFDPWKLEGLDDPAEQVNNSKVMDLVDLLDEIKIVGVRPKTQIDGQPILNADLTINKDIEAYRTNPQLFQQAMLELQKELMRYGFNVVSGNKDQKPAFYSNRGELRVTTYEGVIYNLYFGEIVQGDEKEIEIGTAKSDDQPAADTAAKPPAEAQAPPDADAAATPLKPAPEQDAKAELVKKKNRYLMVRLSFDEAALGPVPTKPTAPVEPTKPENYTPAEPTKTPPGSDQTRADDAAPPPSTGDKDANPQDDKPPAEQRNPEFVKYDLDMQQYQIAKQRYQLDLEDYNEKTADYDRRKTEGQRTVARLSKRFGPWFYVITSQNLDSLQITRDELVQPKPTDPSKIPMPPIEIPDRPDISLDSDAVDAQPAPPPDTKPAEATDAPKQDAPKQDASDGGAGSDSAPVTPGG